MLKQIRGVTIRVRDLEAAGRTHAAVLGVEPTLMEGDDFAFPGAVRGLRFDLGDTYLLLITGVGPDSPVTRAIEKHGEGFSQLAFEVDDLRAVSAHLSDQQVELTSPEPLVHAAGRVLFSHPRALNGVMWEFEERSS